MRKATLLALVLLVSLQTPLRAVHGMVIVVDADQIKIGTDTVPRFLDLPNKLVVAAGQTVTLLADSTFDYLEVAGTLKCSRAADTKLQYTHFFILPGGVLDCGTTTDPVLRKVEFIGRNVPIDLVRDPFQWGNGFLSFGTVTMVGASKATWGPLAAEVLMNAKSLVLGFDPQGWQVGDVVGLTDTVQQMPGVRPRQDPNTVAAISGRNITLTNALAFDHKAIRDPDGAVVLLPRVFNLTRNIVIRSEDPTGTPSHTAKVGADAHWDVRYVQFVGLGRTRNVTLNSLADNKPGTNQVGRYTDHHHHAMGNGSFSVGNSYIGSSTAGKWAVANHGTHDEVITDNVAIGFNGSAFVTEDGYEVRNQYLRNFAAFNLGALTDVLNAEAELTGTGAASAGCPGCTGNGFWFRGIMQRVEGNEAWNNHIGINVFNMTQAPGMYPSTPGGEHDTTFSRFLAVPVNFDKNIAAGNESTGGEYWGPKEFPNKTFIGCNNGVGQLFQAQSEMAAPYLINATLCAQGGRSFGLHVTPAYAATMKIEGGRIVGTEYGIHGGGGNITTISDATFQNVVNFDYSQLPIVFTHTKVTAKRLAMFPFQYIVFNPAGSEGVSEWLRQRGSTLRIVSHNGVAGQDFKLFVNKQKGSSPAEYSIGANYPEAFAQPEAGLTNMQSWLKYGMSYRGEALDETKTVPLDGLINGFAMAGATTTLRSPLAIVTTPNSRETAVVRDGAVTIWGTLTGDFAAADDVMVVSVDGGADVLVGLRDGDSPDIRTTTTRNIAEGPHEIRTWRRDTSHQKIPGSLMLFSYSVGVVTQPPTTTAVPNVVGSQQAMASAAIVGAKLIVGTVTTLPNAAPAGQVLAQMPIAGTTVTLGSAVNLTISGGPGMGTWRPTPMVLQRLFDAAGQPTNQLRFCPSATSTTGCIELVTK